MQIILSKLFFILVLLLILRGLLRQFILIPLFHIGGSNVLEGHAVFLRVIL